MVGGRNGPAYALTGPHRPVLGECRGALDGRRVGALSCVRPDDVGKGRGASQGCWSTHCCGVDVVGAAVAGYLAFVSSA